MNKLLHKVAHKCKRHPMLYFVRYALLSKNHTAKNADAIGCFNDSNTMDSIPKLYFEVNAKINVDPTQDELEKALTIGKFLRKTIVGGSGIGLSSEKTLEMMLAGEGGVCSDFAQVFNIFCFINGIRVKEWGTVDCFYKTKFGHSFNEIYSTQQQKWIAIDIHKAIIFEDVAHNNFFSVIDLFNDLRAGNPLRAKHYSEYMTWQQERIPLVYSQHAMPFLIENKENSIVDYYYNKLQNSMPIVIINVLLVLLRKNQTFIFVLDDYKMKLLPKYFQNLKLSS
ncbi:hypothetical protein [Flavobacterium sp.]|uniref:transglutaminase domain-containing protein n=1 Tax=Flavobacterium sp. TaxID=239 RepID=UPI0026336FB3|nr:hypothetical protein [Flavobacterium sp.]